MFPLPYPPPFDGMLYGLFGLEIALLAGGLGFGKLNPDKTCRLPRALRMTLSAILVLAAFLGWLTGTRGTPTQTFAMLICAGMSLGFVGDLIMAKLIRTPNRLISGMLAFGLGHCFYLAALVSLMSRSGLAWRWPHVTLFAALLGLCAWLWHIWIYNPRGNFGTNAASLVYGLLVGAMVSLAWMLAAHDRHYWSLAGGALLFLISDFILGNWVIRGHFWTSVNDIIWLTYVSGQLLIVYSIAAALNAWL